MLKTPREWPNEALDEFLTSATRILHGSLLRRKTKSNAFEFDADVLSLFAQISPTASHEDLEDFLHYIIESHQFAGASIVFDEIDLDQVGCFPLSFRTIPINYCLGGNGFASLSRTFE